MFSRVLRQRVLPLAPVAVEAELSAMNASLPAPKWTLVRAGSESALEAHYRLKTFVATWRFLNAVAGLAHGLRHHPTITTTYNRVHISLTTHDARNTVTANDTKLAAAIHAAYAEEFAETAPVTSAADPLMNEAFDIIDEMTKKK